MKRFIKYYNFNYKRHWDDNTTSHKKYKFSYLNKTYEKQKVKVVGYKTVLQTSFTLRSNLLERSRNTVK